MKQIRFQLKQLSALQASIILLITGLFLGVLFANVFRNSYFEQMAAYQNTMFFDITVKEIDYSGLFAYILKNNLKEYAIFWMLCITILGMPYMAYKITAFGFSTGFFISVAAMNYGFKGILLILVYVFPHGLIYLPVMLLSLYKGFTLCRTVYFDNRGSINNLGRIIKPYVLMILLLAVVLLVGCFLEAYVGAFLLKKTLGLFI